MKKTLIIALLVALVLGVFTACNGDVFADLVEKEDVKKVITLKISNSNEYSFVDGKATKEIEIPSGCEKWGQFAAEGFSVEVEDTEDHSYDLELKSQDGFVYFASGYVYSSINLEAKGSSTVKTDDAISAGGTYLLTIREPT